MSIGQAAQESSDPEAFDAALRQVHRIVEQLAQVEASAAGALLPEAPDLVQALSDGRRILEHLVTVHAKERDITFQYERLAEDDGHAAAEHARRVSIPDDETDEDW